MNKNEKQYQKLHFCPRQFGENFSLALRISLGKIQKVQKWGLVHFLRFFTSRMAQSAWGVHLKLHYGKTSKTWKNPGRMHFLTWHIHKYDIIMVKNFEKVHATRKNVRFYTWCIDKNAFDIRKTSSKMTTTDNYMTFENIKMVWKTCKNTRMFKHYILRSIQKHVLYYAWWCPKRRQTRKNMCMIFKRHQNKSKKVKKKIPSKNYTCKKERQNLETFKGNRKIYALKKCI